MAQRKMLGVLIFVVLFLLPIVSVTAQQEPIEGRRGQTVVTNQQQRRDAAQTAGRSAYATEGQYDRYASAPMAPLAPAAAKNNAPVRNRKNEISGDTPENRLQIAGLPVTVEGIIKWLNDGVQDGQQINPQNSDKLPREKSQLGVDAIAVLGTKKANAAIPMLVESAAGQFPLGLRQLIEMDVTNTVSNEREPFRQQITRIYRYNSAIALANIGDNRALPVVAAAFQNEMSASAKVQLGLGVALLGSTASVDWIVGAIGSDDKRVGYAASRVFYFITGQDFDLNPSTSNAKRKTIMPKYTEWWKSNKAKFVLDPVAIQMRRTAPPPETRGVDNSLRGQIRTCTNYADFKNFEKTAQIRSNIINGLGAKANRDLETIIFDEMEDVDVRMEALNLMYNINTDSKSNAAGRATMRKVFDRCMRLNDNEVVEKAKNLKLSLEADYQGSR